MAGLDASAAESLLKRIQSEGICQEICQEIAGKAVQSELEDLVQRPYTLTLQTIGSSGSTLVLMAAGGV